MSGPASEGPIPAAGDVSVAEEARLTGIRLAEHPLLAARHGDERPAIEDVLADARPLLSTYGIGFELLRTRPGLVVLRARSDGRVTAQVSCELVKALVGALSSDVCDVKATLVESTCAQRGASACLYSLMWEASAVAERPLPPPPPPETLVDPPLETRAGDWSPPPAADVSTAATPTDPEPADPEPYELPQWDPPNRVASHADDASTSEPQASTPTVAPVQSTATRGPLAGAPVAPTATSSNGHHVQVSTPALVVPTIAQPPVAPAPPVTIPEPQQTTPVPPATAVERGSASAAPGARVRRNVPRGLWRRSWLLVLALLAGSAGGWFAGRHAGTSYAAQASLLVQSGAGKIGPGAANDALALATTYSAVIPKDQAFLSTVASALGTSSSTVASSLGVTVQNNTSILTVSYMASTPGSALSGARAVARVLASNTQVTPAIASGSMAVVNLPTSAHRQGTLHKFGIEIGALLGLLVGLILVLAAERADPRIDDAPTMAAAAGCRAAQVPADISHAELARVLSDVGRIEGTLTVVPLAVGDTASTMDLARGLRPCWPVDGPAVAISPSFASGVVELSRGSGPTVLVTHAGARQRDVVAAADRLRMIGRAPVWAVLAARRLRQHRWGRVG